MITYKILIVDDDPDVLKFIQDILTKNGYSVFTAKNGEEALVSARTNSPHLILLDIMMPGMDGIDVCRELRNIPVLSETVIAYITGQHEDYTQIAGFEAGADDFLIKPIKLKVFLAKINSLLRRFQKQEEPEKKQNKDVLLRGDLIIDRNKNIVFKEGNPVRLTNKEFELLVLLAEQPGRVISREEIMKKLWSGQIIVGFSNIYVHIKNLRKLIGYEYINTIKRKGFQFADKKLLTPVIVSDINSKN